MKLIIAYIQPEKLEDVKKVLFDNGILRISIMNSVGHSNSNLGHKETYRGMEVDIDLIENIRLEIAVNDDFEKITVDAILNAGKTGEIGDGKIFVVPLEKCYRIRTGEEGRLAIG